mgnify:CR=1 FL=1
MYSICDPIGAVVAAVNVVVVVPYWLREHRSMFPFCGVDGC